MKGKRILLGITGGIAAYKAATIASQLYQRGADVRVIMTKSATQFITPLTLQTLTHHQVYTDTFDERDPEVVSHIDLADHADLIVIAPATANIIGKVAHGLGDDMLSTTLLATTAPIVIAPAMNVHMYANVIVQKNIQTLRELGMQFIEPASGQLACGYVGQGRMVEPEVIVNWIEQYFAYEASKPLAGKKLLITAGPTVEPIDPVRYMSNHSSGKMGYAIAEQAKKAGAEVVLVSGPVTIPPPKGVKVIEVKQATEMMDAVMNELATSDIIIKSAAVADYRSKVVFDEKIKKNSEELILELKKNPDIAAEVGRVKRPDQMLIGFAAETEQVEQYAKGKLERKNMDLIIANDVTKPGAGFGTDTNIVTIYDRDGDKIELPQLSKQEVARHIVQVIGERLHART
ncbi:bifunctional phosphopantothenoylcysteine decarboxylase/phosphopantothenate--cysteine ligase CoaBC [Baia soyae]|uniref:Coenzyme A biosynthesis bifunctional protein CoaBC n=1 Tax=Baia soyae TaxID=1544746 RepID=A0A4R2S1A2_9BACL|nr:bifunctional phosphopantothenoylcysteine decarboxylase/phosphopantothenate--cysteine ligase CoaBC [Baia soyae]TCP69781.1 phosphopantothenoylcysteine decarboxylase/phosphopantothenate--cysteine ligase [Baia soyae]